MADKEEVGKKGGKGKPRPLMVVFQVLDDDGNPAVFEKTKFRCLAATRDASVALEKMEANPHATYTRVEVS